MAPPSGFTPQASTTASARTHEVRDIRLVAVVVFLIIIAAGAFAVHGSLWIWFQKMGGKAAPAENALWRVIGSNQPAPVPEFPALQRNPGEDLRVYEREQRSRLDSYRWIDPAAGIVQLPVSRAMQVISERGFPRWKAGTKRAEFVKSPGQIRATPGGPSPLRLQQERSREAAAREPRD